MMCECDVWGCTIWGFTTDSVHFQRGFPRVSGKPSFHELLNIVCLVGGLEHFLFFHILGIVTPTD